MSIKCQRCGNENPDSAKKCQNCGANLSEQTVALTPQEGRSVEGEIILSVGKQKKVLSVLFPENISENFELRDGTYVLGRSEDSDIFLNDVTVSRKHAEISVKGNKVTIRDLDSLNGTFVNNQLIEGEHSLKDGDIVQIGRFKLLFKMEVFEDE